MKKKKKKKKYPEQLYYFITLVTVSIVCHAWPKANACRNINTAHKIMYLNLSKNIEIVDGHVGLLASILQHSLLCPCVIYPS